MRASSRAECPLKIGQDVEILSHISGYRGGYFRCKIHDMKYARNDRVSLYIEYLDFPDQDFEWMYVYQAVPKYPRLGKILMVRPLPPKIASREELDQISGSAFVAVVSERPWEREECVEWLENYVWWKVKVVGIRAEDGLVEVQQYLPPKGEGVPGKHYFAHPRHLRPAFNWTEEDWWTADPRRVTLPGTSTRMGEDSGTSGGSGVSRKRTRPDQSKLYKDTRARNVVSRSKRPCNLWTKKFQKSSDSVAPAGNARPSRSSGEDLPRRKVHKMGDLQWKPLVLVKESLGPRLEAPEQSSTGSGAADTRTDDSALEERLQSYLESEGEDVRIVSELYLLDSVGTEIEGLRESLKAVTQSSADSSCDNGESTGASIVSEASKTGEPHEVKNVPATVHLTTNTTKEVLNSGSDGLQQCKMDADISGSVKPTARLEVTSTTNADASTCLLKDETLPIVDGIGASSVSVASKAKPSDTKVVNDVHIGDGSRTTTSCAKETSNLGLHQSKMAADISGNNKINASLKVANTPTTIDVAPYVCENNPVDSLPKADSKGASTVSVASKTRISDTEEAMHGTEGEQQVEAATVLATSLYKDLVLPNCDKQRSNGVTVQVQQDDSAWQVICVNHDRQGDHEYYLGYCRTLEAANAARDTVRALLHSDGLSVDARTTTGTKMREVRNSVEIIPASDHLHKNIETPEVGTSEKKNEGNDDLGDPKAAVQEGTSPTGDTSEQVATENEKPMDELVAKDDLPAIHDCMDKESKEVLNTRKGLLVPKIENTNFAELPRSPGTMGQRPAAQHTSWNSSRPAGAQTNPVGNNLATSAAQGVPCSPVGAVLPRQGQNLRALRPLVPSAQSMPAYSAASIPTTPVLGSFVAPHSLPMQNRHQVQCWQMPPQPLQDGLLGTSNGQPLQGMVNTQVAGNARCVGGTSVHAQSRLVAWPRACIRCKRVMDGHESMGGRVDCSKCQWAYHTECALADNRLTFYRPMPDHQGPKVAGVYFTCGCNMLQLVLPRLLRSISDGIDALSIFLAGHQNARTLSPHFADVTVKLQGEMCLLAKILQNAPDPFLQRMKTLMEWGSAEFMQGVHLTSQFRTLLLDMILQLGSA